MNTDEKELFLHDWYAILGVEAGSSIDVINRAARKLSIKYHPDKTSDANATDKFLLIQKAKDVLTDESKKKIIDEQASKVKKRQEYETQRTNEMDSRRKKFRDDLEKRVQEAATKNQTAATTKTTFPSDQQQKKKSKIVEDLRNRSNQMMEESRETLFQKELQKQQNYAFYQQFVQQQLQRTVSSVASELIKCSEIKVKWRKSMTIESEDALVAVFGKYGPIENLQFSKNKKHSARIKYTTPTSAQKAVDDFSSSSDYRVELSLGAAQEDADEENKQREQINYSAEAATSANETVDFDALFSVTRRKKRRFDDSSDDGGNDEETFLEKEKRILQSLKDLQKALEQKIDSLSKSTANTSNSL